MSVHTPHLSIDQLAALAFVTGGPEVVSDQSDGPQSLEHLTQCDACASAVVRLSAEAEGVRNVAVARADALFDQRMMDAQRGRILERLAQLGRAARVLSFPHRTKDQGVPVTTGGRRWISVAAAAGLIIGLLAGQMLHLVPLRSGLGVDQSASIQAVDRSGRGAVGGSASGIIPAVATMAVLSDDELMEEIEAALQPRRGASLRALDALTPTAADVLAMGR